VFGELVAVYTCNHSQLHAAFLMAKHVCSNGAFSLSDGVF
jgi:hypothetical protein